MKCRASRNWPNLGLQKQFGMMEGELVVNELKGSRNSGGIGCRRIDVFWIHFEASMRRKQVESGRTAVMFLVDSLGCNYRLMKRSHLR